MKKVELLAPAKNYETAIAAINSGADAIYIGASYFGARLNASNSLESIEKLVNFAHKFYVRVHVTINTILNDIEVDKAISLIYKLYEIGVDAVIIQDFGLLEACVEDKLPPIEIHMSTQCDNRNLEKIKFFDKIGVSRVILARELSIDSIKNICENVSCDIETFIHGALCVCYSGQCYLSFSNGGRSANRGECAQPCRKKYSLLDEFGNYILKDKYLLSLKDFNASNYLKQLVDVGVKSFKIEGRLKDENYVKNVVLYYNNLLNKFAKRVSSGKVFYDFDPDLNKTFNRGYTDYFLSGRSKCYNFISPKFIGEKIGIISEISNNYFKIKGKSLNPQDGLCFILNSDIKGFLINKVEGDKIYPNSMRSLSVGTVLYRNYDSSFTKKLQKSNTVRKIGIKISVKGGCLSVIDEDNNSVTLDLISEEIPNNIEKTLNTYIKQLSKLGKSDFYLIDITVDKDNLPFLPVSEINKLRREALQKLINIRLSNYKKNTQKPICYSKFPLSEVDYKSNILNRKSVKFYEECGCKVCELALEKTKAIPANTELMRTKHCLRYAAGCCFKENIDNRKLYLEDDKGKIYPLSFDCKNCEMIILNP